MDMSDVILSLDSSERLSPQVKRTQAVLTEIESHPTGSATDALATCRQAVAARPAATLPPSADSRLTPSTRHCLTTDHEPESGGTAGLPGSS